MSNITWIDLLFFVTTGACFGIWQDSFAAGAFMYLLINFLDVRLSL